MRAVARHVVLRSIVVWLLLASLSACRWETIWYGAEYETSWIPQWDTNAVMIAAPAPHCGCLTVQNIQTLPVLVQSTLHGQLRSEILMHPGDVVYERFDWAGPFTEDVYQLSAFRIERNQDGTPSLNDDGNFVIADVEDAELPIRETLSLPRAARFDECEELACLFGGLKLDSAVNYQTIWAGAEVNVEKNWIEVAAPEPDCGCLTLTNRADDPLEARASFFGKRRGSELLQPGGRTRVRFDWAGPLAEDRYQIQAYDSNGMRQPIEQLQLPEESPVFRSCDDLACDYGDMGLNQGVASVGRVPAAEPPPSDPMPDGEPLTAAPPPADR
ncbi:MAG: hypothetical protein QGI10_04165 [Vicinamibacterales bacterium]|jgi:hypothetical protein|nr:hypothetical protein [Vicinamibacterales bacterium]MDP7478440.1 hypothetical protein [Vicinamibacterales bacterium]MDP7690389.1 hypothetical protein [Vicinamibacterales bacterium]HJN44681.1 hypothetical protein [Vicinamibacterales bacterium]